MMELPNGMRVVLVDRPGFPTLSARMSVYAGRSSAVSEPGLPDLTATLLRDGTSTSDAATIAARIGESGIAFNTNVGRDVVTLSANGLSTKIDDVLGLLAELTRDAQFPDDRFIARRDELMGEIELAAAQPSFHLNRREPPCLRSAPLRGRRPPGRRSRARQCRAGPRVLRVHIRAEPHHARAGRRAPRGRRDAHRGALRRLDLGRAGLDADRDGRDLDLQRGARRGAPRSG